MIKELLIEIGTEEIPSGYLNPALAAFQNAISDELERFKINFDGIKTYGTPRRLVVYVEKVEESQVDFEEEILGPPKKVAIDSEGKFTKAALGFATSHNIDVNELKIFEKDKKEYVGFTRKNKGEKTINLLKNSLPGIILNLPFPKSMRWGKGDIRFVRPIHWILALFGGEVIPFNIGDIYSCSFTMGHRFMANKKLEVNSFQSYMESLKNNFVLIDFEERKNLIVNKAREIASTVEGIINEDEDLFETVANLCEMPYPMLGNFEERFLALPKEILITTMKKHQKYIPILDKIGNLKPYFIIVSNTNVKDPQVVINGNSKVIRARFSDADYYFEKDKKISLESRVEKLQKVVYQEKLGTYYEKTMRLVQLCDFITSLIAPDVKNITKRAAFLCKADLVTGMVYEFPALQGIIGGELAILQKEDKEVAKAIYEHYLPQSPDDKIPSSMVGTILSLADKLDSLIGFFGIGITPKGASDPYGLRRLAIGIIRILLEKDIDIDYTQLIRFAYENLKDKKLLPYEEILSNVIEFIENRFYHQMQFAGFRPDIIDSVISTHPVNLNSAKKIIEIMNKEASSPIFNNLVLAFKRVSNITKGLTDLNFEESLFKEDVEKKLYHSYLMAKESLNDIFEKKEHQKLPLLFANLKPFVDEYFDKVLVMDKDETIKRNRLAFLVALRTLFSEVMDFTKIQQ